MGTSGASNTDSSSKKATPLIPEKLYGYLGDRGRIEQVKIATSNLFIETTNVPIDYMTGAVFDGIGGNEFINTSGTDTILQQSNSLVSNSSDILEEISSKANEKQSDGIEATMGRFALKLSNYLPQTINNVEYIGSTDAGDLDGSKVIDTFPSRNVYFDSTYAYIIIELDNVGENEQVEVEFMTSDNPTNGII